MSNDKPNLARRSLDSLKLEDIIKISLLVLGPIIIGAMAWQSFADDIEDLEDAGSARHRRISNVEDKQEEYNEKLHDIDKKLLTTSNDVSHIKDDIEEIKKAVVD